MLGEGEAQGSCWWRGAGDTGGVGGGGRDGAWWARHQGFVIILAR